MASQITSLTIVYPTVYSGADQRKSASKLRVSGFAREFPAQMASNAENVSIWWRHHEYRYNHLWQESLAGGEPGISLKEVDQIIAMKTPNADVYRRDLKIAILFFVWQHSEHLDQLDRNRSGLRRPIWHGTSKINRSRDVH